MDNENDLTAPDAAPTPPRGAASPYLIPAAILLAGAMIAGAVVLGARGNEKRVAAAGNGASATEGSGGAQSIRPVDERDHRRGAADATVSIVEFSDFECPFCARIHPTLARIVAESGGKVSWVYRHFPLTSIHAEALPAAVASECFASLGGNDAFWAFTDAVFENQNRIGGALYGEMADTLGVSRDALTACMSKQETSDLVSEDLEEALAAGGTGTPYGVIVSAEGTATPFSGALPYEQIRALVEQALGE